MQALANEGLSETQIAKHAKRSRKAVHPMFNGLTPSKSRSHIGSPSKISITSSRMIIRKAYDIRSARESRHMFNVPVSVG